MKVIQVKGKWQDCRLCLMIHDGVCPGKAVGQHCPDYQLFYFEPGDKITMETKQNQLDIGEILLFKKNRKKKEAGE